MQQTENGGVLMQVKVLLVEDNPSDADLIAELASDSGEIKVDVSHCDTLKKGLALLRQTRFDIVLLDLSLPDARNMEGLQRIRSEHPSLPVVILTGNTDPKMSADALQAGAQDYLPKNELTSSLIARTIRYAISRQKQLMEIKTLRGLIKICSVCHKICTEEGAWSRLEKYIKQHSDADFTHGYCPECCDNMLAELDEGGPQ